MSLALFDLDETLLAADCDVLWGEYLCREGLVDADAYRALNQAFYRDYKTGNFDVAAYLEFVADPLGRHPRAHLEHHRQRYVERDVMPIVLGQARDLIERHRAAGDHAVIVTATLDFVSTAVGTLFGVDDVIAPVAELVEGRYTGRTVGVASFGPGKVTRVREWLAAGHSAETLEDSWFYSDSMNDLPLLEAVTRPVAVDPDARLRAEARRRNWPIVSLRE